MAANTGDLAKFQCLSLVQSDLPDRICSDQSLRLHSRLGSARHGLSRLVSSLLDSARLGSSRLGSSRLGLEHLNSDDQSDSITFLLEAEICQLGLSRLVLSLLGLARLGSSWLVSAWLISWVR